MIYINGRFLTQKMTGVNRFAYELCKALNNCGLEFALVVRTKYIKNDYDISIFKIINWGFGKSHFWEQIILPFFFIFKRKYLLINFSGLGCLLLKNQIITIHDLSFLYNPEWFSKLYYNFYRLLTPFSAKRSVKILTVSEFSKSEIIKYFGISSEKIVVVYNAVSNSFNEEEPSLNLNENYILAVSSLDPRKNFHNLIKAIKLIDFDVKLYIIGDKNHNFKNLQIYESSSIKLLGRVDDSDLIDYYKNARLFIYPSFYEGFGLPPLEAISSGCCTIVSEIDVFKEVFGDAVGYFNPNNVAEIKKCIEDYYFSETLRSNLKLNSYKLKSKYNWTKSANTLIAEIKLLPIEK